LQSEVSRPVLRARVSGSNKALPSNISPPNPGASFGISPDVRPISPGHSARSARRRPPHSPRELTVIHVPRALWLFARKRECKHASNRVKGREGAYGGRTRAQRSRCRRRASRMTTTVRRCAASRTSCPTSALTSSSSRRATTTTWIRASAPTPLLQPHPHGAYPSCIEVAGVLAATAPLGMPSGKIEHHPGWKPLQGSASDHVPGWAPSPCRLPGPIPGYETCLRRFFTTATVCHLASPISLLRSRGEERQVENSYFTVIAIARIRGMPR